MTEPGLAAEPALVTELLAALDVYRPARQQLLATLELGPSSRDPLAEFSEHFVGALMGGTLASSRVQTHYDLITPAGQKVQVRYLANPSEGVGQRTPGVPDRRRRVVRARAVRNLRRHGCAGVRASAHGDRC